MPHTLPEPPQNIVNAIPELEGEVAPEQFLADGGYAVWAWGGVLLALLTAVGVLWWVRRRGRAAVPEPTPLEIAQAQLRELEEALPPLRECGLRVSLVLRRYLQGTVQDPALYETHEEFSRRMDALGAVPEECRYAMRELLERLVDLKYAGNAEQNPTQARSIIEQARALLCRIQEIRQQDAAQAMKQTSPRA